MSNALLQSGPPWLRLMVPGAYLALGLLALVNVVVNVINLPELGDGKVIALILTMRQIPAAKYAIGISVLRDLYFNVWLSPTAQALLPSSLLDSVGFIRTAGILLMAFASVTLLYWQRSRMRLLLACTTPVWLLFSAGYIEYYPFVAGALLAMLCWVFARPLQDRSAAAVGFITSVMPLLHAGFAPLSAIVLLAYACGVGSRRAVFAMVCTAISFLLLLVIFWHDSLPQFVGVLLSDLNLGEKILSINPTRDYPPGHDRFSLIRLMSSRSRT